MPVTCWSIRTAARDTSPRSSITTGTDLIDKWKVFVGSGRSGDRQQRHLPAQDHQHAIRRGAGSISSETYLCIGPFDSKSQAESVLSYLSCRLTRFLILLHKPSQTQRARSTTFVPIQNWTRQWTDEKLYTKYGSDRETRSPSSRSMVRPMEAETMMSNELLPSAPGIAAHDLRLRGHEPAICGPAQGRLHDRGRAEPRCPAVSDLAARQAAVPDRSRRIRHAQ